jgi:hypothetical protein
MMIRKKIVYVIRKIRNDLFFEKKNHFLKFELKFLFLNFEKKLAIGNGKIEKKSILKFGLKFEICHENLK